MMMKPRFLHTEFSTKFSAGIWVIIHVAIFAVIGIMLLCKIKFSINTNLFDILPDASGAKIVAQADRALSRRTGRAFTVLVKHKDFSRAKSAAADLYRELSATGNDLFEGVSFEADSESILGIQEFLFENRFFLVAPETVKLLEEDSGAEEIAENALTEIFSGFSSVPAEYYQDDPFLLTGIETEQLIEKISETGTALSIKDGVLAAQVDGFYYVLLRGFFSEKGAGITNKTSGVKFLYEAANRAAISARSEMTESSGQDAEDDATDSVTVPEFIYSGVPFHSYESSSSAQKEITIISIISVVLLITLLLFVFKSAVPLLFSVLAISVSVLSALCVTFIIFNQIHILTFVFGTTLLGTCFDYSVHFFVRWKADVSLNSGAEIKRHLFKGLLLSLVSTEIGYLALTLAPFALLKQIAVFSLSGILSSFLTVVLLFPCLKLPENKARKIFNCNFEIKIPFNLGFQKFAVAAILILPLVTLFIFRKNVRIENDLKSFYTMKGSLLQNEIISAKILNTGSSGFYYIVRGDSVEELLETESEFCKQLDSYTSVTKYIPPFSQQKKSYDACAALLDYAAGQYEYLGADFFDFPDSHDSPDFDSSDSNSEENSYSASNRYKMLYSSKENHFVNPENLYATGNPNKFPEYFKSALNSLWIGKIGNEYFSVIFPLHVNSNFEHYRKIAQDNGNVFFMNKTEDISLELNRLTKMILIFLAVSFVLLIPILRFAYPWKKVLHIAVVPPVVILITIACLAAFNIPVGFFSVTGIVLIFGLGMDYIIYSTESKSRLNQIAISISFLTTALSFALLAFSSFMPVHMFGLTVFAGLCAAWIYTTYIAFKL